MGWGYDSQIVDKGAAQQQAYSPAPDTDAVGFVGIQTVIDNTGSGGVGSDENAVTTDAVAYAEACRRAVQNGQTIDQVVAISASLSDAAKQEIYAQVCVQQGTSPAEIEAKAEQERQAAMAALQQGLGAVIGLGMAANTQGVSLGGQGISGGDEVSLATLGNLVPLQTPNLAQERERGFGLG